MWPFNLVQHPKVTTWSAMIPFLEFDRKPRTYLIRLFSHTEARRFHSLCLTDSFLMIPLPRVPKGTWGRRPPCRAPREQAKARMRWRQVLSGREQHEYIKKARTSLSLANTFPRLVDFIPAICLKDVLGVLILRLIFPFLHVQHFVIMEKLGQSISCIPVTYNVTSLEGELAGKKRASCNLVSEHQRLLFFEQDMKRASVRPLTCCMGIQGGENS